MKVNVRAGLPGKIVVELEGIGFVEADQHVGFYEGLHSIKDVLAMLIDDAIARATAPKKGPKVFAPPPTPALDDDETKPESAA